MPQTNWPLQICIVYISLEASNDLLDVSFNGLLSFQFCCPHDLNGPVASDH